MEPINYLTQVVDPFVQATQGLKLGSDITELQQKQALIVQQQQQQQLAAQEQARFLAKPNPTMRDALQFASVLPKDRADALRPYIENFSKEQQQGVLKANGQILSALQVKPETGIKLLRDYATAQRNSGDEAEASLYERIADAAADPERGPGMAFKSLVTVTARIPGAKEMFETIDKASTTAIAEAEAPSKLSEQVAKAALAVQNAANAVATAPDDVAKAKAQREYEEAKASKEAVTAKYAEQEAQDAVKKRLADLNLTKAQTTKYNVETGNLSTTGKLLKLDFDAAVKGLPLPSKNAGTTVGTASEDERKAAGWLAQADNAYKNMLSAMYTKEGKRTGAEEVGFFEAVGGGGATRGPERQKFVQAGASLSEALLRAATGAGQNENEAKQKIEELTPTYFDEPDTIKQKLAAIPMYLQSLQARAGRAAPKDYTVPPVPGVFVTTPNGQTIRFDNQNAADAFKKAAGI